MMSPLEKRMAYLEKMQQEHKEEQMWSPAQAFMYEKKNDDKYFDFLLGSDEYVKSVLDMVAETTTKKTQKP